VAQYLNIHGGCMQLIYFPAFGWVCSVCTSATAYLILPRAFPIHVLFTTKVRISIDNLTQSNMSKFYDGDLQSGISIAIEQSKLVACFIGSKIYGNPLSWIRTKFWWFRSGRREPNMGKRVSERRTDCPSLRRKNHPSTS